MMQDEKNWILIFSSSLEHEVEIFRSVLEVNGIEAVVINKKDSFYLIGDIELYVKSEDALSANHIISKQDSE